MVAGGTGGAAVVFAAFCTAGGGLLAAAVCAPVAATGALKAVNTLSVYACVLRTMAGVSSSRMVVSTRDLEIRPR